MHNGIPVAGPEWVECQNVHALYRFGTEDQWVVGLLLVEMIHSACYLCA